MEIRKERVPDYLTALVALVLWRVFFPGLMSQDSILQYGQALTGHFNDWQPPLLAIAIKVTLGLGGALGLLMLGQCLAGVFGVRALAAGVLGFFREDLPPRRAGWLSFLVLLALLVPLSPLAFYLMTLWKDAWAAILLLWAGALALDLYRRGPARGRVAGLVACVTLLGLVRHNAIVVLPLAGLAIGWALRRSGSPWRTAAPLAALPLVLCLAVNPLIDALFHVEKLHPDSQIMAIDLVGLCAADRAVCHRLPWTESHVRDPAGLVRYRPGDIGFIFWDAASPVDKSIRLDYAKLRAEYLRAAWSFPGGLARVKIEAFETLLGIDQTYYFFHGSLVDNPYGLTLNGRFAPVRQAWVRTAQGVAGSPVLRWISGVHLVWLAANAVWVIALVILSFREGRKPYRWLACLLLVPLGYYLSYLLATPAHDFRFMYPSTLMVQCVTLSWIVGGLAAAARPGGNLGAS
jgi:hypothetical protein